MGSLINFLGKFKFFKPSEKDNLEAYILTDLLHKCNREADYDEMRKTIAIQGDYFLIRNIHKELKEEIEEFKRGLPFLRDE